MPINVKIPSMGESITSGIISKWFVKDGDYVEKDTPIYELETDKITSEANAEVSGVINIIIKENEEVDIGTIVASIDENAKQKSESSDTIITKSDSSEDILNIEKNNTTSTNNTSEEVKIKTDSSAENIAKIETHTKKSSGISNINEHPKEDIEKFNKSKSSNQNVSENNDINTRIIRKKMSPLRKKISQRLVSATQESALLTTFNEVDMSKVIKLRKQYQESFVHQYGTKLGFMSFFVKAVVNALKTVPEINSKIDGDYIINQNYYDIGVAVGTEKGLFVPVIRNCEVKAFAEIEKDIINFANKAKDGKITLDDLEGGVFTISNGGIYGSMLSTPIVNYPQPAILGLHNIQERPVAENGKVVIKPMMYLALSYDHRLIDGKEAVSFLVNIKESIEDPSALLIGL